MVRVIHHARDVIPSVGLYASGRIPNCPAVFVLRTNTRVINFEIKALRISFREIYAEHVVFT